LLLGAFLTVYYYNFFSGVSYIFIFPAIICWHPPPPPHTP
jgi:hypothetical protein